MSRCSFGEGGFFGKRACQTSCGAAVAVALRDYALRVAGGGGFILNVAVEMTRKDMLAAKNAKYAKNQRGFTFSDVDSR